MDLVVQCFHGKPCLFANSLENTVRNIYTEIVIGKSYWEMLKMCIILIFIANNWATLFCVLKNENVGIDEASSRILILTGVIIFKIIN